MTTLRLFTEIRGQRCFAEVEIVTELDDYTCAPRLETRIREIGFQREVIQLTEDEANGIRKLALDELVRRRAAVGRRMPKTYKKDPLW